MLKGFRDFVARGNVVDLAVGVVMGGAFGMIVSSLVADVITPFIGMLFGKPDFSALTLGPIMIGKFMNAVVSFLLVSVGVYFFIVTPMNRFMRKEEKKPAPAPGPTVDQKLLAEIRDLLARR